MDILTQILESKRREIAERRAALSLERLQGLCAALQPGSLRSLRGSLTERARQSLGVIAEFKRKSPSKGFIRESADPASIASAYESAGAAALSVLTDGPFFGGSPDDLKAARAAVKLPVLRKEFIIDEYQIWESRLMGADAILLIRAALPFERMLALHVLARSLSLETLWEFHGPEELEGVSLPDDALIGINNRDLKTFAVDLGQTERMIKLLPAGAFVISESGINGPEDLERLRRTGARGILVGESLMRAADPGEALRALFGGNLAR